MTDRKQRLFELRQKYAPGRAIAVNEKQVADMAADIHFLLEATDVQDIPLAERLSNYLQGRHQANVSTRVCQSAIDFISQHKELL